MLKWSLSDNPATIPSRKDWERSSTVEDEVLSTNKAHHPTVNHALITGPSFIHQTAVPVSLELKDTDVRAYRTDPVQVRSWPKLFGFAL